MRFLILCLFLISQLSWSSVQAQEIQHIEIGVNGLHCSACSFSVEKSLKKLPFVRLVSMDLNQRSGDVYFVENSKVEYEKLAKAVVDAGFSVRSMEIHLKSDLPADLDCYDDRICILEKSYAKSNRLRLIGKAFQERKAAKAKRPTTHCNCSEHPLMAESI